LLMIEVIFRNTQSLAGWGKPEMLVILALSRFVEGTMDTLFSRNIAELPHIVMTGQFDLNLLKPGSAQFYTAFRRFHFHNIGNIVGGIGLLIYAVSQLPTIPSMSSWLLFMCLIFTSLLIFYSLLILVASLVFRLERLESMWGFLTLFTEPLTIPFDIFPRGPRIVLTYLLPLAFVVFVPAQALTGRLAWWQAPVAIGMAAAFFILANLTWQAGLRRYSSASS
ncbi:MAG: ABC transporter permease, partial [Acidobacteriota bacterium]